MRIEKEVVVEYTIEKSKFIAYLLPCESNEMFRNKLNELRKQYYDCSHICSAYIINNNNHYQDDGEPSGTAGMPILKVLQAHKLNDCACLVVRYFGGIKLGKSGLSKAYSKATSLAIEKGELLEEIEVYKFKGTCDYSLINQLQKILEKQSVDYELNYDSQINFIFYLKEDNNPSINNLLKQDLKPIGKEIIFKKSKSV